MSSIQPKDPNADRFSIVNKPAQPKEARKETRKSPLEKAKDTIIGAFKSIPLSVRPAKIRASIPTPPVPPTIEEKQRELKVLEDMLELYRDTLTDYQGYIKKEPNHPDQALYRRTIDDSIEQIEELEAKIDILKQEIDDSEKEM